MLSRAFILFSCVNSDAMSEPKSKFAAARSAARNVGANSDDPKRKRSGKDVKQLLKPQWNSRLVGAGAATFDSSVGETLFMDVLSKYPVVLLYKLLILVLGSDSKFKNDHEEDLIGLRESIEDDVVGLAPNVPVREEPSRNTLVLAAHLGIASTDDPAHFITDTTFVHDNESLAAVPMKDRQYPELLAYRCVAPLQDRAGQIRCFCGQPASLRNQRAWKAGAPPTQAFFCAKGDCRLNIVVAAIPLLKNLMSQLGVTHIPEWFCPDHPDKTLKINVTAATDNEEASLSIRCTHMGPNRDFCVNETLGAPGAMMTGAIMWRALDLLT